MQLCLWIVCCCWVPVHACMCVRSSLLTMPCHAHVLSLIAWICAQGVFGAACGAGIIIGAYFAFYSTSKRYLREHTNMSDGA